MKCLLTRILEKFLSKAFENIFNNCLLGTQVKSIQLLDMTLLLEHAGNIKRRAASFVCGIHVGIEV